MATPALLSWSGGKDAAWSLHVLRQRPELEVVGLLTTVTEGFERVSMQGIRIDVLEQQSLATGLPVLQARIPQACDNATYEAAFAAALATAQLRWPGLRDIAFGDLFLADIKAWRDAFCARIGWRPHYPLFGSDTALLAREMIVGGMCATLCCVDTTQLDGHFAGRDFDASLLADLPDHVDPCGERGEFHTCVAGGPMFAEALNLRRGNTVLRDGRFAYTDIELADSSDIRAPTGTGAPGR